MNGMSHMKYMLLGGAAVFAIALLAGVPAQTALTLAFVVACPLMMVLMMAGGGHSDTSHKGRTDEEPSRDEHTDIRGS
jgi:type III secretory pathway component EscV